MSLTCLDAQPVHLACMYDMCSSAAQLKLISRTIRASAALSALRDEQRSAAARGQPPTAAVLH